MKRHTLTPDGGLSLLFLAAIGLLLLWAASTDAEPYRPIHHNIPASLNFDPRGYRAGDILYLCSTLPRSYSTTGGVVIEIDHYLQENPCPVVPIP